MRLSNKSTFSLVCLVALLALGSALFTTPAVAHDEDQIGIQRPHSHPTTGLVEQPPLTAVTAHHSHPTATISVITATGLASPRVIQLAAIADGSASTTGVDVDEFQVMVTFSETVTTDAANTSFTNTIEASPIDTSNNTSPTADADWTIQAFNKKTGASITPITVAAENGTTIVRKTTKAGDPNASPVVPAEYSGTVLIFTIKVSSGVLDALYGTNNNVNQSNVDFRIRLNHDRGAYGLQKSPANSLATYPGGNNSASNTLFLTLIPSSATLDETAPALAISHDPLDNQMTPDNMVTFTFSFDEALGTRAGDGLDAADITVENGTAGTLSAADTTTTAGSTIYTLPVTLTDNTKPVTVKVADDSVKDAAGNSFTGGTGDGATFIPDNTAPALTITSAAVATDKTKATYTFTFDDPIDASTFTKEDLTVTNGSASDVMAADTPANTYTSTITLSDKYAPTTVSVTGSVTDAAGNAITYDSTADGQMPTYTPPARPDGLITIAKNSYVIVVRAKTAMGSQGLDFPRDLDGKDVTVAEWPNMPDLEQLFDRDQPGGGGAIIVKEAGGTTLEVGSVGISEIMWAIDLGYLGQDRAHASQWLELHNLNTMDVNVQLSTKTGLDDILNDTNIIGGTVPKGGALAKPVLDVVTNYFNGKPGTKSSDNKPAWKVKGQNGNSVKDAKNFVSMARILPDKKSKYENKDGSRYNNRDGRSEGHWVASSNVYLSLRATGTDVDDIVYQYHGTPGNVNTFSSSGQTIFNEGRKYKPASSPVIFNEIANRVNADRNYEWIELRNVTGNEVNLRNYLISIVKSDKTDKPFYQFPANDNAKIPANGVFLLVASDPTGDPNHPLAPGWDVDKSAEIQVPGWGDTLDATDVRYKVASFGNIPDDGNFVLMLRKPDNNEGQRSGADGGKGVAETGNADLEKILDLAGKSAGLTNNSYPNKLSSTNLWPLYGFAAPASINLSAGTTGTVYTRNKHKTAHDLSGAGSGAWGSTGFTGIGYKRHVTRMNVHGGTPGYHGSQKGKIADGAKLVISEIMLQQKSGRSTLPQWIELYNPTNHIVELNSDSGWRLVIEEERLPIRTLNFKTNKTRVHVDRVFPKQTILVASSAARSGSDDYTISGVIFPANRVYIASENAAVRSTFEIKNRSSRLLNPDSFNLKVIDGKGAVSDEIGNLDGNVRTSDEAKWKFSDGTTAADGYRTSLIRIFDNGVERNGLNLEKSNVLPVRPEEQVHYNKVPAEYAWVRASETDYADGFLRKTFYGDLTDHGTPMNREGMVLPVELSSFRPTLEDGKVVIRWTTQSELDNAGFNIYRSETRNGEFKQVNAQLIEGAGTTGERNTYKWVDTSAKPGVVYYYQIEDVSFAGERQKLAVNRLKGYISAKDKLTTRWGELKSQE